MVAGPEWFDPTLPTAAECSLGLLLEQRAKAVPDDIFVIFEDGETWTSAAALEKSRAMALLLRRLGVSAGARVLVWLPNGPDALRVIFALSMLGAVRVPLNTALAGSPLASALRIADAEVMVAHPKLTPRMAGIDTGAVRTMLLLGEAEPGPRFSFAQVWEEELAPTEAEEFEVAPNMPWDVASLIFSSGTTGESKAVVNTYAQLWTLGRSFYGYMNERDRMLLVYPLFHIAATGALFGAMATGASLAVAEAFRASEFWDTVRRTGGTTLPGLGRTFVERILKEPPQPQDKDNPLRLAIVQQSNPTTRAFAERFGVEVMACYSMSETSCIAMTGINPEKDATVGQPRKGVQVRIVDENDIEVPEGEVGELVLRADVPWTVAVGYHGNPAATASAWRNGWFHTGDAFRRDADGDLYFVDRVHDVLRVRSENISSNELEAEIRLFPAVEDAAVIVVERDGVEDLLAIVSPRADQTFDPEALARFLAPRLPHFMVPRYFRVVDALPKTATNRVQKGPLRAAGLLVDDWDREFAGIVLKGMRLNTRDRQQ